MARGHKMCTTGRDRTQAVVRKAEAVSPGAEPPSQVAANQYAGNRAVLGLLGAWGLPEHIAGASRPMPPGKVAGERRK